MAWEYIFYIMIWGLQTRMMFCFYTHNYFHFLLYNFFHPCQALHLYAWLSLDKFSFNIRACWGIKENENEKKKKIRALIYLYTYIEHNVSWCHAEISIGSFSRTVFLAHTMCKYFIQVTLKLFWAVCICTQCMVLVCAIDFFPNRIS